MTLYEFYLLSPKEKEVAAMNGDFLADRRESEFVVCLYSVGDFFVEVWYDQARNEISMLPLLNHSTGWNHTLPE